MSNQYPPPPPGSPDPNQPPAGSPPAGPPPPPPPPPPAAPGAPPPSYGDYAGQSGAYGAPPPGYPPPGAPGGYDQGPKTSVLAIVSLVTGILGLLCCGIFVFSIAAAITGFMARKEIAESGGQKKGQGMAMAGLVLGIIGVVLAVLYWILFAAGAINYSFTTAP